MLAIFFFFFIICDKVAPNWIRWSYSTLLARGNCHIVGGKICATDCVLIIFVQLCWRVKSALLFLYLEYLLQFHNRCIPLKWCCKIKWKEKNFGPFFSFTALILWKSENGVNHFFSCIVDDLWGYDEIFFFFFSLFGWLECCWNFTFSSSNFNGLSSTNWISLIVLLLIRIIEVLSTNFLCTQHIDTILDNSELIRNFSSFNLSFRNQYQIKRDAMPDGKDIVLLPVAWVLVPLPPSKLSFSIWGWC